MNCRSLVGWHHWLKGHEAEQTLGDGEGQGSLACYSSCGCKQSDTDMIEWLNKWKIKNIKFAEENLRKYL